MTNPSCWSTYITAGAFAQPYITTPIPLLYRRNIARFHTRSHTFAIERDSWQNVPCHAKICRFWDLHAIEIDEHVPMQCPRYKHIRDNFNPILGDSTQLLLVPSTASLAALGAFITHLFLYREESSKIHDPSTQGGNSYIVLLFLVPWVIYGSPCMLIDSISTSYMRQIVISCHLSLHNNLQRLSMEQQAHPSHIHDQYVGLLLGLCLRILGMIRSAAKLEPDHRESWHWESLLIGRYGHPFTILHVERRDPFCPH